MAAAEQAASAAGEQWVHLHIPLDPSNPAERRFGELFEVLPNGMKTHFCKAILVDGMPADETEIDMMLARLIREKRLNGKRRGRPRSKDAAAEKPAPVQPARPAESAPPAQPVGDTGGGAAPSAPSGAISDFAGIAGGSGWGRKTNTTQDSKGGTAK